MFRIKLHKTKNLLNYTSNKILKSNKISKIIQCASNDKIIKVTVQLSIQINQSEAKKSRYKGTNRVKRVDAKYVRRKFPLREKKNFSQQKIKKLK